MLALRLPPEIEERLQAMADKSGRSKSYYAREAILYYLEDLEDAYLGQERLARFRASGEPATSLDEVMAEFEE